ncbi:MAG: NAD(P)-binding domain-containing protein, partial [Dehalococcoidia bacterium]|nr:NAD(P)-binding domain-containing protein [Dehalococcoidia bacterium]
MAEVAVIGATTWGRTLAGLLANKGVAVSIWTRTEARAEELRREQQDRLSKADLPDCLSFTNKVDEALRSAEFAILAVPAQTMRQNVRTIADHLTASTILVSVAKGLEAETGKRMSQVITEEVASGLMDRVCVLSGPNLSK